eukprot:2426606-Alexandrium_andersonii.AAC.1
MFCRLGAVDRAVWPVGRARTSASSGWARRKACVILARGSGEHLVVPTKRRGELRRQRQFVV